MNWNQSLMALSALAEGVLMDSHRGSEAGEMTRDVFLHVGKLQQERDRLLTAVDAQLLYFVNLASAVTCTSGALPMHLDVIRSLLDARPKDAPLPEDLEARLKDSFRSRRRHQRETDASSLGGCGRRNPPD